MGELRETLGSMGREKTQKVVWPGVVNRLPPHHPLHPHPRGGVGKFPILPRARCLIHRPMASCFNRKSSRSRQEKGGRAAGDAEPEPNKKPHNDEEPDPKTNPQSKAAVNRVGLLLGTFMLLAYVLPLHFDGYLSTQQHTGH